MYKCYVVIWHFDKSSPHKSCKGRGQTNRHRPLGQYSENGRNINVLHWAAPPGDPAHGPRAARGHPRHDQHQEVPHGSPALGQAALI